MHFYSSDSRVKKVAYHADSQRMFYIVYCSFYGYFIQKEIHQFTEKEQKKKVGNNNKQNINIREKRKKRKEKKTCGHIYLADIKRTKNREFQKMASMKLTVRLVVFLCFSLALWYGLRNKYHSI